MMGKKHNNNRGKQSRNRKTKPSYSLVTSINNNKNQQKQKFTLELKLIENWVAPYPMLVGGLRCTSFRFRLRSLHSLLAHPTLAYHEES